MLYNKTINKKIGLIVSIILIVLCVITVFVRKQYNTKKFDDMVRKFNKYNIFLISQYFILVCRQL